MTHRPSAIHPFSADPDFDFEVRCVLGGCSEGVSDPGEVLAAIAGVRKGDHEGWYTAWSGLAQRTLATAHAAAAGGAPGQRSGRIPEGFVICRGLRQRAQFAR